MRKNPNYLVGYKRNGQIRYPQFIEQIPALVSITSFAERLVKKRSIILYWLLLLVPTFVIGVAAFKMLRHEQDRIDQEARFSARDRVRVIAESLQITVSEVEEGLTQALYHIKGDNLVNQLSIWEDSNPLIRNVFVWGPKAGLKYPVSGMSATWEERRFITRYNALFSGRIPWHSAATEKMSNNEPTFQESQKKRQPDLLQDIQKLKIGRKTLVDLAKGGIGHKKNAERESEKLSRKMGGWIPWFEENRLYILGWVQQDFGGHVYGVELELMTLLSRLVADFPASVPEGMVYALIDGSGKILHQAGKAALDPGLKPGLAVPLAPYMPHWQVAVYFIDSSMAAGSGKGFIILSGLLLAIFLIAIILGGSLLTWQAHRNMADARQKTSFVSNVSHELKTPLTSIRMYAELLNEDRIKGAEKKKQYLKVIASESQRLTRLVNNVLDFSRLEQGRKKYRIEDLELTGFLHDIIELNRLRIKEAGLVVKDQVADKDVVIRTDRDAIEQVILNLIDNVIKYAADGRELVIDMKVLDGSCEIRFMDRGPGVPSSHRNSIFDKFHRVDDSLTARQPGSGLGLSIARRLLRQLDGDILYKPRVGGGSIFVVSLAYHSR